MNGEDQNFLSDILLQGEGGHVASLDDLNFEIPQDTQTQEDVQASRSTKGAKRTKNFHYKEDEVICSAWLNVSKDPINGANQSRSSFWGRVLDYFDKHKKTTAVRIESSIMHRWLTIQLQVNKFCSCYDAILRRNQSGLTIEDKIDEAKKLYVEWDKDHKSFGLLHCWTKLKAEDEWKAKMIELAEMEKEKQASKKKQKSSTKVSRPRDEEGTNDDEVIEVGADETIQRKRPEGIKKAKENLRRGGGEACLEALDKMMAKKEVLDMEKEKAKEERFLATLELEKAQLDLEKRVANEEKKAEAKLLKEEKEIMLADASTLNSMQREWLETMQKKIVEKQREN